MYFSGNKRASGFPINCCGEHLSNCAIGDDNEKRLARVLLSLAHFENDGQQETDIPKLSHETFAAMIGTTRSRVSFFMNKFRKLGYIDYHGYNSEVHVRSSLHNVFLHD